MREATMTTSGVAVTSNGGSMVQPFKRQILGLAAFLLSY